MSNLFWKATELAISPLAFYVRRDHMQKFGIRRGQELASRYYRWRYGRHQQYRIEQYRHHFDEILAENGSPAQKEPIVLNDGWALDNSQSLPHLERILDVMDQIIAERGGKKLNPHSHRPFLQNIMRRSDTTKYPAILDFITSSEIMTTICNYLGFIPSLSNITPLGLRLHESRVEYDEQPDLYRESQLFHCDYHYAPIFYVIVFIRDVTMESGPFSFLPMSASQKAIDALQYGEKTCPYRIDDETMYSVVDKKELHVACYPRGTVLYIQADKCFHYGSRNSVNPRYLMMYALTAPGRNDFKEILGNKPLQYPIADSDSRLRKMILDREYLS